MTRDDPAFPHLHELLRFSDGYSAHNRDGLTKREYAAIMALQGLLANSGGYGTPKERAETAVREADALLKALSESREP